MDTNKRILIITDAWHPQINGVVTTLSGLSTELGNRGHVVGVIEPSQFRTMALPVYKEIRIVINPWKVAKLIKEFKPDHVHIATEGPLGVAARLYMANRKLRYTTSYHTNFPEFIKEFTGLPARWFYPAIRWFHKSAEAILVTTPSMKTHLESKGFKNLIVWNRAVDTTLFSPAKAQPLHEDLARPIMINVGRVSPEKNLDAFLSLDLPGTKVIVGSGPELETLSKQYPEVVFVGPKKGEELAAYFASADVFVFPSLTDTFGLVMIESLASGVPVAAYPVTGPVDVITNQNIGCLDSDLSVAITTALQFRDPTACREHVLAHHTSKQFVSIFLETLTPLSH